jgi:hypothetical protein
LSADVQLTSDGCLLALPYAMRLALAASQVAAQYQQQQHASQQPQQVGSGLTMAQSGHMLAASEHGGPAAAHRAPAQVLEVGEEGCVSPAWRVVAGRSESRSTYGGPLFAGGSVVDGLGVDDDLGAEGDQDPGEIEQRRNRFATLTRTTTVSMVAAYDHGESSVPPSVAPSDGAADLQDKGMGGDEGCDPATTGAGNDAQRGASGREATPPTAAQPSARLVGFHATAHPEITPASTPPRQRLASAAVGAVALASSCSHSSIASVMPCGSPAPPRTAEKAAAALGETALRCPLASVATASPPPFPVRDVGANQGVPPPAAAANKVTAMRALLGGRAGQRTTAVVRGGEARGGASALLLPAAFWVRASHHLWRRPLVPATGGGAPGVYLPAALYCHCQGRSRPTMPAAAPDAQAFSTLAPSHGPQGVESGAKGGMGGTAVLETDQQSQPGEVLQGTLEAAGRGASLTPIPGHVMRLMPPPALLPALWGQSAWAGLQARQAIL